MLLAVFHAVHILESKKVLGLQDRRKNVWKRRPMLPKIPMLCCPVAPENAVFLFVVNRTCFVLFISAWPEPIVEHAAGLGLLASSAPSGSLMIACRSILSRL
jgi:hypothetical protein